MWRKRLRIYLTDVSKGTKVVLTAAPLFLAACSQVVGLGSYPGAEIDPNATLATNSEPVSDYNIVTVLPRDAIPAIDNPKFVSADEAGQSYSDDELVLGVEFNGDARAYSIPMLSTHEIVNDTVGGVKIAVTW